MYKMDERKSARVIKASQLCSEYPSGFPYSIRNGLHAGQSQNINKESCEMACTVGRPMLSREG